ncbi:MAG: FAD:protein FMN transferase [Candidatus Amulumruptor caecigallinarius]|nr:FAD:protein FMN transferase [Candidatus Amulumruptor caecigallinarius]
MKKVAYKAPSLYLIVCFLAGFVLPLISCGNGTDKYESNEGMIWHTEYHIAYRSDRNLGDSILSVLSNVGKSLNFFDSTSVVSRVNRSGKSAVDSSFSDVYKMALRVNHITDGAYDPTVSPLVTAWGFGKGHKATSDTLRLDSLLAFVGINRTSLRNGVLEKKDARTEFNFSSIAKGFGCDRVGEMFHRLGVNDYMVEIGGEICAAGKSPRGGKWRVSVDKPSKSADDLSHASQVIIEFTDMGMATSGNYRNYHEKNGRRYGHTMSPITGRPVETDVLSATVLAPTAMEADALATAFMVIGSEKSRALAAKLKYPVMLILSGDSIWTSPQFKTLIIP